MFRELSERLSRGQSVRSQPNLPSCNISLMGEGKASKGRYVDVRRLTVMQSARECNGRDI